MSALGTTAAEIDIRPAAERMLADMGHPYAGGEAVYDVTFENVQAGLRTDYLFRLANHAGALVIGTGDLSELALGWCTYGVGDQMSHYAVNTGVPKTLIQHLIRWVTATGEFGDDEARTLRAVLDTEISPELVPAGPGEAPQSTEATIGPYALQDFNLYYTLRHGFRPVEDRLPGASRLGGCRGRCLAAGFPVRKEDRLRPAGDPALARRIPRPLLRLQPVQALGAAQRAEGRGRRRALSAGRLARALGRIGPDLARRAGAKRA